MRNNSSVIARMGSRLPHLLFPLTLAKALTGNDEDPDYPENMLSEMM